MTSKSKRAVLASLTACAVFALATAPAAVAQSAMPGIWNGLYVGGTAGYGDTNEIGPLEPDGGVYGFYGGYNHAFGPWVAGLEVDYTWTSIEDSIGAGGDRVTIEADNLGSVRGRLGYSFNQALVYGTAGYAWGEAGTNGVVGGIRFNRETDFDGFVLGGGLEYKFAPNISARVEGLHYWLEPDSNQDVDDLDATVVRGGLTFHFNGQ